MCDEDNSQLASSCLRLNVPVGHGKSRGAGAGEIGDRRQSPFSVSSSSQLYRGQYPSQTWWRCSARDSALSPTPPLPSALLFSVSEKQVMPLTLLRRVAVGWSPRSRRARWRRTPSSPTSSPMSSMNLQLLRIHNHSRTHTHTRSRQRPCWPLTDAC